MVTTPCDFFGCYQIAIVAQACSLEDANICAKISLLLSELQRNLKERTTVFKVKAVPYCFNHDILKGATFTSCSPFPVCVVSLLLGE